MDKIKYLQKLISNDKALVSNIKELVGKRGSVEEIIEANNNFHNEEIKKLLKELKTSSVFFEESSKITRLEKEYSKIFNMIYEISLYIMTLEVKVGKTLKTIKSKHTSKPTYDFSDIIDKFSNVKDEVIPIVLSNERVIDLSKMPHLLVAGQTGSGKSVFLNTACLSIITKKSSKECKLALIDPKRVEFTLYDGIEHLWSPIATKVDEIDGLLSKLIDEMEERYELLKSKRVKNLESYNKEAEEKLPHIVVIIDELADLMLISDKGVENKITRLAQLARAVGIHMILATQKPVTEIMTGLIKANMPARLSFKVMSKTDSRVIIDEIGAEDLRGKGEAIFMYNNTMEKLQAIYVSEDEIKNAIKV